MFTPRCYPRLIITATLIMVGCGGAVPLSSTGKDSITPDMSTGFTVDAGSAPIVSCSAKLEYGQKDAYVSAPGRNNPAFPPHTSTRLRITCPGGPDGGVVAEDVNHGTSFSAMTDGGAPMLTVLAKSITTTVPSNQVAAILTEFQLCECPNAFVSVNETGPNVLRNVASSLSAYLQDPADGINPASCSGGVNPFTADLTPPITLAQVASFYNHFLTSGCAFDGNGSWTAAFTAAIAALPGKFHVCNNDAQLETYWFTQLQAWSSSDGGVFPACTDPGAQDGGTSLCGPPSLYYTP